MNNPVSEGASLCYMEKVVCVTGKKDDSQQVP